MSFGLLSVQNQMKNQATSGLRQVAGIQQQNKAANDALNAAEQQKKMSAIGTGASLGMAAGAQAGSVGGPMGMAIGAGVGWLASEIF